MFFATHTLIFKKRILTKNVEQINEKLTKNITVNQYPLSNFIKEEKVDLLKLDIEGSEEDIITELYKKDKLKQIKRIILEYHFNKDRKNKFEIMLEILLKSNFKISKKYFEWNEGFRDILINAVNQS